MKKMFLVFGSNGRNFGGSEDLAKAEAKAKKYPGASIVVSEQGADYKWRERPLQASDKPAFADGRPLLEGHTAESGIGGLVYKAIVEGWTVEQARQAFVGQLETALWGAGGRPAAAGPVQASFMAEWANAAVQAEFGGNLEGFLAYKRLEAKGLVRHCGINGQG